MEQTFAIIKPNAFNAGNAGMVAAILNAGATGNIDVTANGAMTARFGVDAENFGSGSTSVTTVGPVNVTTGNGIFALSTYDTDYVLVQAHQLEQAVSALLGAGHHLRP